MTNAEQLANFIALSVFSGCAVGMVIALLLRSFDGR